MSLLRELNALGALRTLDDALANTLRRLDPSTPDAVLAAAALASLAVANGHAAFDVAQPRLLVDADVPWPEAEAWTRQLAASPLVAVPDAPEDARAPRHWCSNAACSTCAAIANTNAGSPRSCGASPRVRCRKQDSNHSRRCSPCFFLQSARNPSPARGRRCPQGG